VTRDGNGSISDGRLRVDRGPAAPGHLRSVNVPKTLPQSGHRYKARSALVHVLMLNGPYAKVLD
jgi:hypothetical protein